eukprot:SAG31_NODE_1893_length_6973_cov_5.870963_1_plen_281_part_00
MAAALTGVAVAQAWFACVYPCVVASFRAATSECGLLEMARQLLHDAAAFAYTAAILAQFAMALSLTFGSGDTMPQEHMDVLPFVVRFGYGMAISTYTHVVFVRGGRAPPCVDMSGKVCLVTGANTGIGFETAQRLAEMGATVILACRSESKAATAIERILHNNGSRASQVLPSQLLFLPLDLASISQVRSAAAAFSQLKNLPGGSRRLDVLVCNAGMMQPSSRLSADRLEMTVATNHYGHAQLVRLLLPQLEASGAGRIVVVSSALHRKADRLDLQCFAR